MCWCMYRWSSSNDWYNIRVKAEVMKVSPDIRFVLCIINREHLTFQKIGCQLNSIMNDVVSMVSYVKTCVLNSRLFKILC